MEIGISKVSKDERQCTKAFVRANKTVQKLIGELETLEQWEPQKLHRQENPYTRRTYTERGGIEKREYFVKNNFRENKIYSPSRNKVDGFSPGFSKVIDTTKECRDGCNNLEHEKGNSNALFPQISGTEKLLSVLQSRMKTKSAKRLKNLQFPSVNKTGVSRTNDRKDKPTTKDKNLNLKDVVEKYRELNNSKVRLGQEKSRLEERIHKALERLQLNTRTREEKERDRKAIKRHELKIERLQNKLKHESNAQKQRQEKGETDNTNRNAPFGSTHLQCQRQFRKQGRELFRVNGKVAVGIQGYEIYYADDSNGTDILNETSDDANDSESVESDNGYVFFPPIPAPFQKKRPRSPIIIDDTDSEEETSADPNKIRLIKVPNRRRVAKQRKQILEQQERFARAYNIHVVSRSKETVSGEPSIHRERKPSGNLSKSQIITAKSTNESKLSLSSPSRGRMINAKRGGKKSTQFDEKSFLRVAKQVNGKLLELKEEREKFANKRQGPLLRNTTNRDLSRRRILYLMGALSVNHLYPPGMKGPKV